jgi:translocation and assembly module TamA
MRLVLGVVLGAWGLLASAQTVLVIAPEPALTPAVQAPPGPAGAASGAAPGGAAANRRAQPIWRLDIKAPKALETLLRTYLDLARDEAISRGELRRLVAGAPAQARSLLEAEGYFAAQIKVKVGEDVVGQPTLVEMEIEPGPQARIGSVQLVFEGELDTRLGKNDPQAVALVERVNSLWALPKGEVFQQARWSTAKNAALAQLRAEGYPTATWSGTSASVDAKTQVATLFLVADSGPAFVYGPLRVEGLVHQPESAIANLMSFKIGEPYREKQLLDFQERVQKLNLFESVFITSDDDPNHAKAAALVVQVRELPLQQATLAVGVSSDTGPRMSVEHLHRLLFGWPWQAKSKVQWGRDESVIQTDLTSHPRPGGKRWLGALQFSRQVDTDGSLTLSGRLRAGVQSERERLERTTYAEYQRAVVYATDGLKLSEASAFTATQQWVWRDLDNNILPTMGITANLSTGAGQSFSTLDSSGLFARAYGRLTWYKPLPARWFATARAEGGLVLAQPSVSVPDTLLFKAGGDESVRGYAYRSLGEVQEGVVLGGRTMFTGSLELGHPLMERIPSLWWAVFADVGDAARTWSTLQPKWGYGAGLRWRSPVGPLRLDAAYGQDVQQYRVHFSVGITL